MNTKKMNDRLLKNREDFNEVIALLGQIIQDLRAEVASTDESAIEQTSGDIPSNLHKEEWDKVKKLIKLDDRPEQLDLKELLDYACELKSSSEERLYVLENLVLRNVLWFEAGVLKVFVSCRFVPKFDHSMGWITWLEDAVNQERKKDEMRPVEFIYGRTRAAGDLAHGILESIAECHCFLGIFSHEGSRFLAEELGAAIALAKPVVICAERNTFERDEVPGGLRPNIRQLWFSLPEALRGQLTPESDEVHSTPALKEELFGNLDVQEEDAQNWYTKLVKELAPALESCLTDQAKDCEKLREILTPLFAPTTHR